MREGWYDEYGFHTASSAYVIRDKAIAFLGRMGGCFIFSFRRKALEYPFLRLPTPEPHIVLQAL